MENILNYNIRIHISHIISDYKEIKLEMTNKKKKGNKPLSYNKTVLRGKFKVIKAYIKNRFKINNWMQQLNDLEKKNNPNKILKERNNEGEEKINKTGIKYSSTKWKKL